MADWLTAAAALDYLGVVAGGEAAASVEAARLAAVDLVERLRPDLVEFTVDTDGDGVLDATPEFMATDSIRLGALLLIGRYHARKGSPVGIATFGELGAASILRTDPDVAQLLGVGRYATPRVG